MSERMSGIQPTNSDCYLSLVFLPHNMTVFLMAFSSVSPSPLWVSIPQSSDFALPPLGGDALALAASLLSNSLSTHPPHVVCQCVSQWLYSLNHLHEEETPDARLIGCLDNTETSLNEPIEGPAFSGFPSKCSNKKTKIKMQKSHKIIPTM